MLPIARGYAALSQSSTTIEIFMSHRNALVNYANSIVGERSLAEDVVQDAYIRQQRAERSRTDDEPLDDPLAYLFHIVRNLAIDVQRRLSRERRRAVPIGLTTFHTCTTPEGLRPRLRADNASSARGEHRAPRPDCPPFGSCLSASLAWYPSRRLNSGSPTLAIPQNPSSRPP